jgi:quinol monooxygenase YgiN
MMADNPIAVVGRFTAQVGKARALRDLLGAARQTARGFPACRSWILMINRGNPRQFAVLSEWDNVAAYEARMRDASWVELTGRLPDLVEGEIGFDLFDVIP